MLWNLFMHIVSSFSNNSISFFMNTQIQNDKEIFKILELEVKRQLENLELIASENFVSPAVLEAAGSVLTNKYAEG